MPGWCKKGSVTINNQPVKVNAISGSYIRIEREWVDGDQIKLTLPMEVGIRTWQVNQNSVSVDYGPLTFSLKIPQSFTVVHKAWPKDNYPFSQQNTPIEIKAKGRQIPSWKIDKNGLVDVLPSYPAKTDQPIEDITLIPMGAARLRISAFPVVK